jgi:hypothetical protein
MTKYQYNDGGRREAGYKGFTGDCVARAIAIATEIPYKEVYTELKTVCRKEQDGSSVRNGIGRKVYYNYLRERGWRWTPCRVYLSADELPSGRIICLLRCHDCWHLTTVIDGVINDRYDPLRGRKRWVYGYYSFCSPAITQ